MSRGRELSLELCHSVWLCICSNIKTCYNRYDPITSTLPYDPVLGPCKLLCSLASCSLLGSAKRSHQRKTSSCSQYLPSTGRSFLQQQLNPICCLLTPPNQVYHTHSEPSAQATFPPHGSSHRTVELFF